MSGKIELPIGSSYLHGQRMSADARRFATIAGRNARYDMHAIRGGRMRRSGLLVACRAHDHSDSYWSEVQRNSMRGLGLGPQHAIEYVDAVCYAARMPIHDPGPGMEWVVCTNEVHADVRLDRDDCPACGPHWGWVRAPTPHRQLTQFLGSTEVTYRPQRGKDAK